MRDMAGWNDVSIAGLNVGHLCPDCQTPEEWMEAELRWIEHGGQPYLREIRVNNSDGLTRYIEALVRSYPTPEIMRHKASQLEAARKDASENVRLMRCLADDMESGELWETPA